jgi:hypothetical protein
MTDQERRWPSLMRRALAAEYAGVDESTIDRHRRAGTLRPAGKLGGTGAWTYARPELDRWLRGGAMSENDRGVERKRELPR